MICFPNAKINIGLNIVARRDDGYHDIETVFYPVNLCDILEIIESDVTSLHISGLAVDGNPDDNLCVKAYRLLSKKYSLPPVSIYLHKVIPSGAGLGGGSSDGAFALTTINSLFNLGLTLKELENFASQLGSDCAFFIRNSPVFASGRGNVFSEISFSLKGYYIAVIKPNVFISTAEAYSWVEPKKPNFDLKEISNLPLDSWKVKIENDFQQQAAKRYPLIENAIDFLCRQGAVYTAMSGSGSAVFGIFENNPDISGFPATSFLWTSALK